MVPGSRIDGQAEVSIVIPCYNQGSYLHESVLASLGSYSGSIEILVVDDGSTDRTTLAALKDVVTVDPSVRVVRQQNQGLSAARNRGIEEARGRFVQFLDADDILVRGKIDAQVAHLASSAGLDVSVTNFLLCDDSRSVFTKPDEPIARFGLSLTDFLYRWERGFAIPVHCALFKREVFDQVRFDVGLRAKEDWVFWCSLVAHGFMIGYLEAHDAVYRQHDSSMRRSLVSMGDCFLRASEKINAIVKDREPGFLAESRSWFESYYRSHPAYAEEMRRRSVPPTPNAVAVSSRPLPGSEWFAGFAVLDANPAPPVVSVVVPVHNHFDYLPACLASLLVQGDVSLEVVCVNDASTDARVGELLRRVAGASGRVTCVEHEHNAGISRSQNEAVELARAPWVAFLDCDDRLAPMAIDRVLEEIDAFPSADYFFSDRFDIDEDDRVLRTAEYGGYPTIRPSGDIRSDLLDGMVASHLKVVRRSAYLGVGGCDESVSGVQDWDLAFKIAESGTLRYIHEPLYYHRVHSNSVTKSATVTQFRRTNIVRRRFAERWLRAQARGARAAEEPLDVVGRSIVAGRLSGASWLVWTPGTLTLAGLKEAWAQGRSCGLDARGEFAIGWVNFVREFNSYFDIIVFDAPEVYGALVGYLWSESVLWSPSRALLAAVVRDTAPPGSSTRLNRRD